MDKIGRTDSDALLSQQVSESRYCFIDLAPRAAGGVGVALGGREQCNPDYVVQRERYPYHVLEIIVGGEGEAWLPRGRQPLRAGVVFAVSPRMPCQIRTDPVHPLSKYFVALHGRAAEARLRRAGVAPGQARSLGSLGEVRNAAEELIRAGRQHGPRAREICAHLLEVLLLQVEQAVERPAGREDPSRANYLRCRGIIDTHAAQLMTLRDMARRVGLEESSVCRLFRRYQGTSPYQYLLRRKMTIAAELLMGEGVLVKEAAQRVGFADPYHFSRVFKSVHGVSPRAVGQYRAAGQRD